MGRLIGSVRVFWPRRFFRQHAVPLTHTIFFPIDKYVNCLYYERVALQTSLCVLAKFKFPPDRYRFTAKLGDALRAPPNPLPPPRPSHPEEYISGLASVYRFYGPNLHILNTFWVSKSG